jgi:hypothetical protein
MLTMAFSSSPTPLNSFARPEPSIFKVFPTINLQIPLRATPFFSHLYKTPGCRTHFQLQNANSFASYHIHVTQAASCSYALFCATAPSYPSYFQSLPHSFYRHGVGPPLRCANISLPLSACPSSRRGPLWQIGLLLLSACYPLPTAHYPLFFANSFHSIPTTV